jgi:hypothetical protein
MNSGGPEGIAVPAPILSPQAETQHETLMVIGTDTHLA